MKTLRVVLGIALVLAGLVAGIGVTLHYFGEGILYIRAGHLREGLVLMLLWSEILGIVTTLIFVVPGILVMRNLEGMPRSTAEPTVSNQFSPESQLVGP